MGVNFNKCLRSTSELLQDDRHQKCVHLDDRHDFIWWNIYLKCFEITKQIIYKMSKYRQPKWFTREIMPFIFHVFFESQYKNVSVSLNIFQSTVCCCTPTKNHTNWIIHLCRENLIRSLICYKFDNIKKKYSKRTRLYNNSLIYLRQGLLCQRRGRTIQDSKYGLDYWPV